MSKYEKFCKILCKILLNILISALVSFTVIIIISFYGHRNFVNAVKNGTCIITCNNILKDKKAIKLNSKILF
jgi:membrane-bound acyltransferase YfiQ involved in biofilm formation